MNLLADAMSGVGAALLPVAAGLLLEELTLGGLVRLLLAPRPKSRKGGARREGSLSAYERGEPKTREENRDRNREELRGARCSH